MIKMRGNKVLVKADEKIKQVGSILLAEKAQKTVEQGTIVSSAIEDLPTGTKVVYDRALTIPLNFEDEDYLVIDEEDCWGIV